MEKAERAKAFTFLSLVGEQFSIIFLVPRSFKKHSFRGLGYGKNHS